MLTEKERINRHYKWRKRARKRLPEIASRVFALRGKCYLGSGFHYDLEKDLGGRIKDVSSYSGPRLSLMQMGTIELFFEMLFERVVHAESSILK